jgi:hypothetical protein
MCNQEIVITKEVIEKEGLTMEEYDMIARRRMLKLSTREELLKPLARKGFDPGEYLEDRWGVAYHIAVPNAFRDYLAALSNSKTEGPVTVFNFARLNLESAHRIRADFPEFNYAFIGEQEVFRSGAGKECKATIVFAGSVPHSDFVGFLRQSDLPVFITGDASLAEAISMDALYLHQTPDWKHGLVFYATELARTLLSPSDAWRVEQLFSLGRSPIATGALFYDSDFRDALRYFNTQVRELLNLPQNLANIIRDGLALV